MDARRRLLMESLSVRINQNKQYCEAGTMPMISRQHIIKGLFPHKYEITAGEDTMSD